MSDVIELAAGFLTGERMVAFGDAKAKAFSARATAHREAATAHNVSVAEANRAYREASTAHNVSVAEADRAYNEALRAAALEQLKAEIAEQEKSSGQGTTQRDSAQGADETR